MKTLLLLRTLFITTLAVVLIVNLIRFLYQGFTIFEPDLVFAIAITNMGLNFSVSGKLLY